MLNDDIKRAITVSLASELSLNVQDQDFCSHGFYGYVPTVVDAEITCPHHLYAVKYYVVMTICDGHLTMAVNGFCKNFDLNDPELLKTVRTYLEDYYPQILK